MINRILFLKKKKNNNDLYIVLIMFRITKSVAIESKEDKLEN